MPNRRDIKKEIKSATNLLIEDAFMESMEGDAKEAAKMDQLIDELIDERYAIINQVSAYPKKESRSKIKKHFSGIREDLEKLVDSYTKKIGRVG
tara:strand:+ start:3401 stop:3682 length:282 start_codon:yes stop_codon:yes gene_type:complete